MTRQNFFAQKFQIMIVLCFFMTILNFPLCAQETKSIEMRYCPYCGMANLTTSKFCNACGTRLPDRKPLLLSKTTSYKRDSLETANLAQDWTEPNYRPQDASVGPITAGLVMGTIGFFGGALVGYEIDKITADYEGEWDGFGGVIIGAPIGESLLLPVGVHLANGRRGNLPLALLASFGIAGTGIAVAASSGDAKILVAIPIAQLLACTAIERSTSRNAE
jgi:zinc-ribbon domain